MKQISRSTKYKEGDIILITKHDSFHEDIFINEVKLITHVTNLDYIIKDIKDSTRHDGCYYYHKTIERVSVLHNNYLREKKLERILDVRT